MSAVLQAQEPGARYLAAVQPALVRQFEVLATAPGGVGRLRELILTLAVQGKLVPQDPSDEPASELLRRIREEKDRLAVAGKIKRDKVSPTVAMNEAPFVLPDSWVWSRLGAVAKKVTDGTHHSPANFAFGDFKYLSAKNIKSWGIDLTDVTYVPSSVHQEIYARCDPEYGDILFIKDGATTGVLTINTLKEQFSLLSSVAVVKPSCGVTSEFLALLMRSPFFYQATREGMTGVAITRVTLSKLGAALVPLPPLAEQPRIVARVDELMRLCDALEAQGRLEAEQHARLLGTLLGTLTDSSTPEELAANWQRVADHFDLLLERPEAVDALEQTILQLAVRGLLVSPGVWTKSRLGDVVAMLNGYAFKSEWFLPSGVRLVRNVNVSHGSIDWHQAARVSAAVSEEFAQFALSQGDVVLTLDRPIISTGLKLAVVEAHDLPCLLLQRVARLSPDLNVLSRDFMLLWLRSDSFMKAIDPGRSNGVPHISTKQVAALTIDLPPLAEQACIVTRVTELRRLCAALRQRLATSQTTQSHLAAALVDSATA